MPLMVLFCASFATAVNCCVAPGAIDTEPGVTVPPMDATNAGTAGDVVMPASTSTPAPRPVYGAQRAQAPTGPTLHVARSITLPVPPVPGDTNTVAQDG